MPACIICKTRNATICDTEKWRSSNISLDLLFYVSLLSNRNLFMELFPNQIKRYIPTCRRCLRLFHFSFYSLSVLDMLETKCFYVNFFLPCRVQRLLSVHAFLSPFWFCKKNKNCKVLLNILEFNLLKLKSKQNTDYLLSFNNEYFNNVKNVY